MSRDSQDRLRNPSRGLSTPPKGQRNVTKEVEKLNIQLKKLSDSTLNKHPYLLSVPSDVPYRHSTRFVNTWHIGTPFAHEEELLQYMSFFPHQEEEESLLHVVGEWSDDKGNMLQEEDSPREPQTSGNNTPVDNAQRKKISLNDYKIKGKSSNEPVVKAEEPRDLEKQAIKVNGTKEPATKSNKREERGASDSPKMAQSKKRPRDESLSSFPKMDGSSSPIEFPTVNEASPKPEKRPRMSSPTVETKDEDCNKTKSHSAPKSKTLPGLLSPTLPSQETARPIPPLVSPTLPPSITGYFARNPTLSHLEGSVEPLRTDTVRSILASAGLALSSSPGVKKGSGRTSLGVENRVRSDSQHSVRSTISVASGVMKPSSPGLKAGVKTPIKSGTPLHSGFRSSPGPRQRHTIALKYGKRNRKRVEALLKFAPRPKKPDPRSLAVNNLEPDMHQIAPRATDSANPSKKPALERSPDISLKKQKPSPASLSLSEKPSTPIPAAFQSPSIHTNNQQPKSAFSTPKKDLKSSAMQRVASGDGMDARTPTGDRPRLSTPLGPERSIVNTKVSPPPTSVPSQRDDERSAWHGLSSKYFALGRTIKREATGMGQFPSDEPNTKESALSVVLLIEALLCFMVNLTADSYYRSNSDPGWSTILPYHIFVFRAARRYPHLHGVVVQLGAVCRQYIHKYNMDRLARDPLPEEQVGSAPTPGSDGNTKTNEDGEKYKEKYLKFRDELVANSRELQTAWMNGSRELSLETLEHDYPNTWQTRARDSALRGVAKQHPNKISYDFFLPLDANATTVEAVRFTLAFLEEWTAREKIEWRPRIEL